ncbi:MAG: 2-phospho-L-lactate guanylyltransferase [Hyphomicrobiales bacterium]|nr:2-phospho-L-lactate guanylyltransferase [Hyphomicrobiales bacterium]MCP4999317.1 2-phospho-L-lactate guanylyltransferase [Hyphomicrobiales bacterium]
MTEIIIPIKSLTLAKQRLAPVLTPSERVGLVLAMLEDLLATVVRIDHGKLWVVASDDTVFDIARKYNARPVCEQQAKGYNEAVMLGLAEVSANSNVTVLPGDIPLATGPEIAALTAPAAADKRHIRLAAARDLQGTNGLFLSQRDVIRPAFGPDSFSGYKYASHACGLRPQILEAPGLALDIDTSSDLHDLAMQTTCGATHEFLGQLRGSVTSQLIDRGAA